jgi:flagellar FliJ protein
MFQFKLQPVLNYRKQIEDRVMAEFAGIKRHRDAEVEVLERMKHKRTELIDHLNEMGKHRMRSADIAVYCSYISHMKDKEEMQVRRIAAIEREMEEKRTVLVDAVKNRKVIEIIKENKLQEHKVHILAQERKELDELAILRSSRGA